MCRDRTAGGVLYHLAAFSRTREYPNATSREGASM